MSDIVNFKTWHTAIVFHFSAQLLVCSWEYYLTQNFSSYYTVPSLPDFLKFDHSFLEFSVY